MAENKKLLDFQEELKALFKKYNIVLDVKAEIVAVDLSAMTKPDAKQAKESVGLVGN